MSRSGYGVVPTRDASRLLLPRDVTTLVKVCGNANRSLEGLPCTRMHHRPDSRTHSFSQMDVQQTCTAASCTAN
eukprot:m.1409 g.1409  ORF g.1409 m.1409 type:complete len:74 (+) comp949_c0_seq1:172-393(+)